MKQKRLSTKIATFVTITLIIAFGVLMATVVFLSGKTTSTSIRAELTNLAHANGNEVQSILDFVSIQASSMQDYINKSHNRKSILFPSSGGDVRKSSYTMREISNLGIEVENHLINTMWCAIKCNEDLFGIGVFFEPGKFDENTKEYSIYATRADVVKETVQFEDTYSNYSEGEYYKPIKESGKPYFSKPYIENGVTMITASYPITYEGDFKGVVLADIDIGRFSNLTTSSEEFKTLHAGILTDDLTIVYDSESDDKVGQNLVNYFKDPQEIRKITDGMATGEPFACDTIREDGRQVSRFFYPINVMGKY